MEEQTVEENPLLDDWMLWWTWVTRTCLKAGRVQELRERMSRERTKVFDWMELRKQNDVVIDIREFWLAEEVKVKVIEEKLMVKTAKMKTALRKEKEAAEKVKLKEEIKRKKVATGERKKRELLDMLKARSTRLSTGALLVEQSVTETPETETEKNRDMKNPEGVELRSAITNGGTPKRKCQVAIFENFNSPSKKRKTNL